MRTTARRMFRWPRTLRGRVLLTLGVLSALLIAAAGFVASSIWIENRYPSDEPNRALAPSLQRAVTKPVVNVVSRQMERYVRRRAEAMYMKTGLTVDQTIVRFLDERVDLTERRIYAYRLARTGCAECFEALRKVFESAPPEHKAFMAQLIGSTGNPEAKPLLVPLLGDADESVALAAMRGLSAIGGDDVAVEISAILDDPLRSQAIRIEAAAALGSIGTSGARDSLLRAFANSPSTDVATQILDSLGHFDFSKVEDTFDQYLHDSQTSGRMRVAAVEALAQSSDAAVPFLLRLAESDRDPEVRASSAWALAAHDTAGLSDRITEMLQRESDSEVRRRLYETLCTERDLPAERLLQLTMGETDVAARVAGFNAMASAVKQSAAFAAEFDHEAVPELLRLATNPNSLNIRMRAVFALRRAQTAAARSALEVIATGDGSEISIAARNGLREPQS